MVMQSFLGKIAVTSRPGARTVRRAASWRIAMFVAMLGFMLRALVPLGFMPDARALQAGHIELTLCSPGMTASKGRAVGMQPWVASAQSAQAGSASADTVTGGGNGPGTYRLTLGPTEHAPDSLAQQVDCPFGLMAAQGVMGPPETGIALAPVAQLSPIALVRHSFLAVPTLGPPLGSRAPPAIA